MIATSRTANFCCTNNVNLKSALCFDFTFDLGKNTPSLWASDVLWTSNRRLYEVRTSHRRPKDVWCPLGYYVSVTSFHNTGLINKSTKKSPTILRSILICHKKDENTVKRLCDTILDSCPGLSLNLKVIGADGESSILNQACNAFPAALLIICIRHIRENIKRNLPSSLPEETKKSILDEIFGTPMRPRISWLHHTL